MSQPQDRRSTDRNMLFGIFALQMDFISQDALVAAMHSWVLDKKKTLGEILLEQGQLSSEQHQALDGLIAQHLKAHGDDPQRSLEALSAVSTVPHGLARVADAELQASLASWSSAGGGRPHEAARSNGCRYRVLRPHKEGGLGTVLVAEDTELHREVALKEIKPEYADDPIFRDRFLLEGEITGRLEHPGIVPVYGLGVYDDGRPYYAMRFIDKGTFKQAIDDFHAADKPGRDPGERSLAFRDLLRHFIDACKAVAYAHDRGVLHRDLKPGNIMLGSYGETLVVDWGLAKAGVRSRDSVDSGQEETRAPTLHPWSGSDLGPTRSGAKMGTLGFSSPEQAAGRLDELTPTSDVYSLGATLYMLLTGRKPFFDAESDEIEDWVQLGRLTPPRQVRPDTPPALDAVCRKAMALRPAERYQSALDLAGEIEHWLGDEPVAAYTEPWTVRAGRWARQHRTLLVAAAVLLVSAVAALTVSTTLIWREEQKTAAQKEIAEKNYELARELSFASVNLIESAEAHFAANPRLQATRKEILTASSRAFRQYLDTQPDDPQLRKKAAQVFRFTANVHRLFGEMSEAEPLHGHAIQLYEGLAEEWPEQQTYRMELSGTLRDFSTVQARLGRLRQAGDSVGRAVQLGEALWSESPDQPAVWRTLATALLAQATNENVRGLFAESGKTAVRAEKLFGKLVGLPAGQGHPYDPLLRAAALNMMAVAERETGQMDRARNAHRTAMNIVLEMRKRPPEGVNSSDVIHFLASFGLEQSRTLAKVPAKRAEVDKNLGELISVWGFLTRRFNHVPMYREMLGEVYQVRGQLREQLDRAKDARADLDRSRELLSALVEQFRQIPSYRGDLGRTYTALGRLARAAGDKAAAADYFSKAVDALQRATQSSPDHARHRRSLQEVKAEIAR